MTRPGKKTIEIDKPAWRIIDDLKKDHDFKNSGQVIEMILDQYKNIHELMRSYGYEDEEEFFNFLKEKMKSKKK